MTGESETHPRCSVGGVSCLIKSPQISSILMASEAALSPGLSQVAGYGALHRVLWAAISRARKFSLFCNPKHLIHRPPLGCSAFRKPLRTFPRTSSRRSARKFPRSLGASITSSRPARRRRSAAQTPPLTSGGIYPFTTHGRATRRKWKVSWKKPPKRFGGNSAIVSRRPFS